MTMQWVTVRVDHNQLRELVKDYFDCIIDHGEQDCAAGAFDWYCVRSSPSRHSQLMEIGHF